MPGYGVMLATFLGASVEWVEAFTIVLAVSLSIGWPRAATAAGSALAVLAVMTLAGTALLAAIPNLVLAQGVIGIFLIFFGLRWLGKAMARAAGLKALHDETEEFAAVRASTAKADGRAAWLIAFNGTLLEGLEVWLIVVALGVHTHQTKSAVIAALAALAVVGLAGTALRKPLARVPENAIKFIIGAVLLAFGTFWGLNALGYDWPFGDAALPALVGFYLLGGLLLVAPLKARVVRS
jgi:uncharacterized membrane protein